MTDNVLDLNAARGRSHPKRLEEAGWQPKERLGRRIYQHPESGCWYSPELALEMENRRREDEGESC